MKFHLLYLLPADQDHGPLLSQEEKVLPISSNEWSLHPGAFQQLPPMVVASPGHCYFENPKNSQRNNFNNKDEQNREKTSHE